jgi:hypothetical protein
MNGFSGARRIRQRAPGYGFVDLILDDDVRAGTAVENVLAWPAG